jgi:hypothetical protein
VVNTHLPCCDQETERQQEADEIMAFLRDAISPGGLVDIPEDSGILLTGDMNLVGYAQQLRTLLTGDIFNEAVYGADFAPDWDGSALLDLASAQTEVRMPYTWRSTGTLVPARIDMMLHTDSVLGVGNHFTLYTPEMSPEELAAHGLEAGDSPAASDHLPHVVDFYDRAALSAGSSSARPADVGLVAVPNPMRSFARVRASVPAFREATAIVYDALGREVRHLAVSGSGAAVTLAWDGLSDGGRAVAGGAYFIRLEGTGENGEPFRREGRIDLLR